MVDIRQRKGINVLFLFILFILIFHFQNCAPPPEVFSNENDDLVSRINDVNKDSDISFRKINEEVHWETETLTLRGLCQPEQIGAVLAWSVTDKTDNVRDQGYSVCQEEGFSITLESSIFPECNTEPLLVTAQLGLKHGAGTLVRLRCPPDFAFPQAEILVHSQLQAKTSSFCQYEVYLPLLSSDSCRLSCYSSDATLLSEELITPHVCEAYKEKPTF